MSQRPFCVKGGEIIGNVPTIEELAFYIKDYILNDAYSSEWGTDIIKGATRQAVYNIIQTVVGQLEYKGLWDASGGTYPSNPELGWYYVISVAGEIDGVYYYIGDWIIWNGTSWDKLTGKSDVMPIGTILMYDGVGIANVSTREVQIGDEIGDTIKMAGWFVCNGLVSTPNMVSRFVIMISPTGQVGGSNDAVVVEHDHGGSTIGTGTHQHDLKIETTTGVPSALMVNPDTISAMQDYYTQVDGAHDHGISNEGVSGAQKNMPLYYSVIYIIKIG